MDALGGGSGISAHSRKKSFETIYTYTYTYNYPCAIGLIDNYIYIIGLGGLKGTIYKINPETKGTERLDINNPTNAIATSSLIFNNKIYVFFNDKTVGAFNGSNWETIASTANYAYTPFVYNNDLYAVMASGRNSEGYIFKLNGSSWESIRKVTSNRYNYGTAVQFGDYVYFVGSTDLSSTTATKKYNMNTGEVTSIPDSFAENTSAAFVNNNRLYVLRGKLSTDGYYEIDKNDNVIKFTYAGMDIALNSENRVFIYKGRVLLTTYKSSSSSSYQHVYEIGYSDIYSAPKGSRIYTNVSVYGLEKDTDGAYVVPETQEIVIWSFRENECSFTIVR